MLSISTKPIRAIMARLTLPILPLIISTLITVFFLVVDGADPTMGFTPIGYSSSNLIVQKPYDVAVNQRYSFSPANGGEHRFWVYSTDKPHEVGSNTKPRTEIRIAGFDYTSGVWQFQGYFYVPSGTSGVCIQQVFGGVTSATTSQTRVYGGSLTHYGASNVLEPNIYNRWIRFNVIHDVGANNVKIFLNGEDNPRYNGPGRGASTHYFKFGVYAQDGSSNYMESRWRDIKIFRK